MKRLVYLRENGAFPIRLEQRGKDKFVVIYGQEEHKGEYAFAARKLGEALMHSLACEGKII